MDLIDGFTQFYREAFVDVSRWGAGMTWHHFGELLGVGTLSTIICLAIAEATGGSLNLWNISWGGGDSEALQA